jgi:hypothetical protein
MKYQYYSRKLHACVTGRRKTKWKVVEHLYHAVMLGFYKVYKSWQFAKNEQCEYHELYATIFH